MNKVQLTLTTEEVAIIEGYGSQLGYSLPKTLRFIISKAAESFLREKEFPVFSMSEKTEKVALRAIEDHSKGRTKKINNVDAFLDEL